MLLDLSNYLTFDIFPPFFYMDFQYIYHLSWLSSCSLFLVSTSSPSIIYIPRGLFHFSFFVSVYTFSLGNLIYANGFNKH